MCLMEPIRVFVTKGDMLRIHPFLVSLFSELTRVSESRTNGILSQIYGLKMAFGTSACLGDWTGSGVILACPV